MSNVIIQSIDLCKTYHDAKNHLQVLKNIQLSIQAGDLISIVGPSGSGKSTLLHLLGGLDAPSSGQIFVQGTDWQQLSEVKRCQLRNKTLGFVYQFHHLLPEFSALENVAMPLFIARVESSEALHMAEEILKEVGLGQRLTHKPAQLSGGERQRVAIARALVHKPACVFADEPTGNLDQATAAHIFDLMLQLNQKYQTALVMVTHDTKLSEQMCRKLVLENGVLNEKNVDM